MSEIKHPIASTSGEYAQNDPPSPEEYFEDSKETLYFTSLNTGYCISRKCAGSQSSNVKDKEKVKRKIFTFSRRTVHKRMQPLLKRKITREVHKIHKVKIKLKHSIPSEIEKKEWVNKIGKIKNRLVYGLPAKLKTNIRKPLKISIVLTKPEKKSKETEVCDLTGEDAPPPDDSPEKRKAPKRSADSSSRIESKKGGKKLFRKLLRIMFSTSPLLKERFNTYITLIQPYSKSDRNASRGSGNASDNGSSRPFSYGTNPEFPPELNDLLKPTKCDLCIVNMNSYITAYRHYNSQAHNRRIKNWFSYRLAFTGVETQGIRHFPSTDPTEYYCQLCTINLPSSRHAIQHYNGRRHRAVVLKTTQLRGIGYFDLKGEWVETGKVIDKSTGRESAHVYAKTYTGIEQVKLYDATKSNPDPVVNIKIECPNEAESDEVQTPVKQEDIEEEYSEPVYTNQDFTEQKYTEQEVPPEPPIRPKQEVPPEQPVPPQQPNTSSEQKHFVKFEQAAESDEELATRRDDAYTAAINDSVMSTLQYCIGTEMFSGTNIASPAVQHFCGERQAFGDAMASLFCTLCNIQATSQKQMLGHLKGSRHAKKMKIVGETQKPFVTLAESLVLHDPKDLSVFRTPSGSYYCDMCKVGASDRQRMGNHISSKKHAKMERKRKGAMNS